MKSDLSRLTAFVTTLFTLTLPIGINCCGYNQNEIISLMSQDSNYKRNPCYIQWKEEQEAKLRELSIRREQLEKSIARIDEIEDENRRREDESRDNTYTSTTTEEKKQISMWSVLGIILGAVGLCCCGACLSCVPRNELKRQTDDEWTSLPTRTSPILNDLNTGGHTSVSITPEATIDAPVYQTTSGSLPINSNINVIGTENLRLYSQQANVPLLPRGVISRQNSLPNYDEAMRMTSHLGSIK